MAAAWLAFGLDTERTVFYRQSDVAEVTELAWYLNCFSVPAPDARPQFQGQGGSAGGRERGLFSYPMLMAADILLYDADFVPVGKDQLQHWR